jgi:hypothetical protein
MTHGFTTLATKSPWRDELKLHLQATKVAFGSDNCIAIATQRRSICSKSLAVDTAFGAWIKGMKCNNPRAKYDYSIPKGRMSRLGVVLRRQVRSGMKLAHLPILAVAIHSVLVAVVWYWQVSR